MILGLQRIICMIRRFSFSPARILRLVPQILRDKLKSDLLVLCSGQGPWEEWNERRAKTLAANLKAVRLWYLFY
jgi:hypothetical protein